MRSSHSTLLILVVLTLAALQPVYSVPVMLLKSTAAKCVQVDAAHQTTLQIHYFTPDVTLPAQDDDEEEEEEDEEKEGESGQASPFQKDFGDRYKRKMEALKKRAIKSRDMNILVVSRPVTQLGKNIISKKDPTKFNNKGKGTQKLTHQIENVEGTLVFETGGIDGHVEICVQSLSASRVNPARIALNITARAAVDEMAVVDQPQNEPPLVLDPSQMLSYYTSGITEEMTRLHTRMREVVANAEYSRDVEVGFHQQSVELNKAVFYWPAFRILILIVAGVVQVTSVLNYMKSRHYI